MLYYIKRIFIYLMLDPRSRMFYDILLLKKYLKQKHKIEFGDYLEFGAYEGGTVIAFFKALKKLNLTNYFHMFVFDSFVGLPDKTSPKDDHHLWQKGMFDSGGVDNFKKIIFSAGIQPKKITLIDGFYEDSLKKFNDQIKPGIINIDCDYYSSTKIVLEFLKDKLIEGTIIYFDDLHSFYGNPHKGMPAAINEFNNNNNIGLTKCPHFEGKYQNKIYWVWKNN